MSGWLMRPPSSFIYKEVNYGRNAPHRSNTTVDRAQMEDLAYSWYYRDYSCNCAGFIADTTCIPAMVMVRHHVPTDRQWTRHEPWRNWLLARAVDRPAQQDQPLPAAGISLDACHLFLICISGPV